MLMSYFIFLALRCFCQSGDLLVLVGGQGKRFEAPEAFQGLSAQRKSKGM